MTPIEILQEYRIPFRQAGEDTNVRQGWVGLHCPYCGRPEDKFYLGWNLSTRQMSCWSCGGLPAARTLAELTGLSTGKCRVLLGEMAPAEWEHDRSILRGQYAEPPGVADLWPGHRKYLAARGFNPATIERLWGVRGIGLASRLRWRLFIPVLYRGGPVTWTTRTIGDGVEPRYISAPAEYERLSIKQVLYGGDYIRHAVIVCEGPLDVWAIGPGAVGLSGIGYSPAQVAALARVPVRYVCFDAEPAAQQRAAALCRELAPFPGATANIYIDAKDPASAGAAEIGKLRKILE